MPGLQRRGGPAGDCSDAAGAAELLEQLSLCEEGTRCKLPSPDCAMDVAGARGEAPMPTIAEIAP
eukprot:6133317-Lingulodinium_polyedra.AAC.1